MASESIHRGPRTGFIIGWLLLSCQLLSAGNVFGQAAPFYKDKTIRIIVGFTPGGLYDQYARLLARHMGKYIPGNPNIIVQNMPGAGSLSATNYIYGVAKPDGLTLGMIGQWHLSRPMLGRTEASFDVAKLPVARQRRSTGFGALHEGRRAVEIHRRHSEPKEAAQVRLHGTSDLTTIYDEYLERQPRRQIS